MQCFSVTVATPGTPQQLIKTTTPALAALSGGLSGNIAPKGSCVTFQADPTNTASKNIYIGAKSMSVSGRTGIGLVLAPGAFAVLHSEGDIDLSDVWVDVDTAATIKNLFVTVS